MNQVSERIDPLQGTLHGANRDVMIVFGDVILGSSGSLTVSERSVQLPEIEVVTPSPPWLMAMVEEINAAAQLPSGWDSYGGRRLNVKAAVRAIELLERMGFTGPSPWVSPSHDGGLHLEWDRGTLSVKLDVDEAGDVEVVVDDEDSFSEWTSNALGDEQLEEILQRVTDG
jgi:hypothetical protein